MCCLEGRTPEGADTIGVRAEFASGVKNLVISAQNDWDAVPVGSNATSYLVACGVVAAFEMLTGEQDPGLHWPDEYGSAWIAYLKDNDLVTIEADASDKYDFETENKTQLTTNQD